MSKSHYKWSIVAVCIFILAVCLPIHNTRTMYAQKGNIDLSQWDFNLDGNVRLGGKWMFYWNQLIEPGDFEGYRKTLTGYYDASKFWTKYKGLNLPSIGYATYHIVVDTVDTPRIMSIKTPEIYSEYRLWVNGTLFGSNGMMNNEEIRYLCPKVYTFYQEGDKIDIVLQVKNVTHSNAGLFESFILGTPEKISRDLNADICLDIVYFSISLFVAIYHIFLFMFRKKEKTLLWFAILCFVLAVRSAFINEDWIMQLFPAIPFWVGSKIMFATIPFCTISLLMYSWYSYQEETPKKLLKVLMSIHGAYMLIVVLTPTYVYASIYNYYLLGVSISVFLLLYTAFKLRLKRMPGALLYLTGLLIMSVSAFNDMLYYNQLVNTGYYLSTGLVIFVVIQSLLFAKRYARAHHDIEQLSFYLRESLERIDRTETAYLQAQIKPHFLYNSLNTIAACCEVNAHEAGNLILSLAKYLRGTLDFANLSGSINLKKELELVKAYTSIEKARFDDINIIFDLAEPLPSINLPPLTIQPLVENAIKHGLRKKEGMGTVKIKVKIEGNELVCTVEDDGVGIQADKLKDLLKLPSEGGSIGLYNIHTRLDRLYGKGLYIDTTYGKGTTVSFEIPYRSDAIC